MKYLRGFLALTLTLSASVRADDLPPLDRTRLPAPKDILSDPKELEKNREIMTELWDTNLGQAYLAYLTDPTPAILVPGRARELIARVYRQGEHLGKRQKAILAFTLDLYARGHLSNDMLERSHLWHALAKQKETDGMDANSEWVIRLAIVGALAAVALGSPAARTEIKNLRALVWSRCRGRACEPLATIGWRKIVHPGSYFTKEWDYQTAWNTFGLIAGGGSMLYSFGFEKLPGFRKNVDLDRELLNGKEKLLDELEF